MDGERRSATEQQLGVLIVMQKIEQAAFDEAIQKRIVTNRRSARGIPPHGDIRRPDERSADAGG
ncbi:hypothetical protein ACP0HM_19640 [Escherichia coli]